MPLTPQLFFASFRLDLVNACLWNDSHTVTLRPKTFRVLQYLLEHAGQLVTKEELLQAVWSEMAVSDAVLKVCIGELRKLLHETIYEPQFITTVHRRGYRFIGKVKRSENGLAGHAGVDLASTALPPTPSASLGLTTLPPVGEGRGPLGAPRALLVERESVLHTLHERLGQAQQGQRQTVFLTGEAGIGKTAVVEAFAAQLRASATLRLGRGQCSEQYGTGAAYLPILEALGQLCRQADGDALIALLRQQAPTWLVHLPCLLTASDRALLQEEIRAATRQRMLREIAAVLDTLATERLLLLILEDLHWSDYATLELLTLLARRRTTARLMILGTYRPAEIMVREHPLWVVTQELQRHSDCKDIPLALLSPAAVAAYVKGRFPGHQFPASLPAWLYEHTDGHPLFVVTLVQALIERGVLERQAGRWTMPPHGSLLTFEVPFSLWQMLERQLTRLPEKAQRILEVASVAGVDFATALVARGLDVRMEDVEAQCEELVQQQWLRPTGVMTWPDGTATSRYSFTHTLSQQAAYKRLGESRRLRLHQRLGARLEAAYGAQAPDIAVELAVHFERAQDVPHAIQYWQQAATVAASRHAHREVRGALTRALRWLETLPATGQRDRHELAILTTLAPALRATSGQATAEVERVYRRALILCEQVQDPHQHVLVLMGLQHVYETRGACKQAKEVGEQLLGVAQQLHEPSLLVEAHRVLGRTLFFLGEFPAARRHFEQGLAIQVTLPLPAAPYERDPEISCRTFLAWLLWLLGYPDQARHHGRAVLQLARERAHPHGLTLVLLSLAELYQVCGDAETTRSLAEEAVALAQTHDFALGARIGAILGGWAVAMQGHPEEGIAQLSQGLTAYEWSGTVPGQSRYLALLAETYLRSEQTQKGLKVIAQALAHPSCLEVCYHVAELHRLKSALLTAQKQHPHGRIAVKSWLEIEDSAQQALALARCQGAKGWELRSAITLGHLWQQQGKDEAARQVLEPLYAWFSEGFDTVDLQQARALLAELV